MAGCRGLLSLCQRWLLWLGSPILMTQKLSLNECILCFGTIFQPICLFSVIWRKNSKFCDGLKKNDACQYCISVTQRFITKNYIFEVFFFLAECIHNHIDTLFKFYDLFHAAEQSFGERLEIFKLIYNLSIFISCYLIWCYCSRRLDIINLPQMLQMLHKLRAQNEWRERHQHLDTDHPR